MAGVGGRGDMMETPQRMYQEIDSGPKPLVTSKFLGVLLLLLHRTENNWGEKEEEEEEGKK